MKKDPGSFFENRTLVLLALILPALIVYAKSLKYGFTTMDEQWMIVKDTAFLEKWSNLKGIFLYPSTEIYYRPLFMITLMVDYHLGKLSPLVYHLSNLAWHLLNIVLLYSFLVRMDVKIRTAFIFALLFSLHPILLHAVAWIPGRNDIMLSVFTLSSLIYLKKFTDTPRKKHLLLQLLFFICALFTKESAIILPLIYSAFYIALTRSSLKKAVRFILLWSAAGLLWLLLRNSATNAAINTSNDFLTNLQNFLLGLLLFIGKAIYPLQQSVLPSLKNTSLLPGIITLTLLVVLCFKPGLKNKSIAFLGLFTFFILLLIPVWFGASKTGSEHYEQRMYGAMAGMILFLTQLNVDYTSKLATYGAGLLFILFLLKTGTRMSIYKNELAFLDAGINECPEYHLFYVQKADILNNNYKFDEAILCYNKCLALRPDYPQVTSNRGSAYFRLGRYKEAIADFTNAIEHAPFNEAYYLNRCISYSRLEDMENAMKDLVVLKKCCKGILDPDLEKRITKKWVSNLDELQKKVPLDPKNAELYFKISKLYFDIEMTQPGITYLKQASLLDPENDTYKKLLLSHKI